VPSSQRTWATASNIKLTGAIAACVLLTVLVLNRIPRYRYFASEKIQLTADQSFHYYFTLQEDASKIKFNISRTKFEDYYVILLREFDFKNLERSVNERPRKPIFILPSNKLLEKKCQGDESFTVGNLNSGKYYIWVEAIRDIPFNAHLDLALFE
jgi:hypothetical protein